MYLDNLSGHISYKDRPIHNMEVCHAQHFATNSQGDGGGRDNFYRLVRRGRNKWYVLFLALTVPIRMHFQG